MLDEYSFDVLGLTETHGQHTKRESPYFLCGGPVDDGDPASGVAIRLSGRAASQVIPGSHGFSGSRITWVRIRGLYHTMFVVLAYIPYFGKTGVTQEHVLEELDVAITKNAKHGDCVILMGDFNLKLARSTEGFVGKFCVHPRNSPGGKRMMEETEGFLPESQAGFREDRGCRDNVVVLTIMLDTRPSQREAPRNIGSSMSFGNISGRRIKPPGSRQDTWRTRRRRL